MASGSSFSIALVFIGASSRDNRFARSDALRIERYDRRIIRDGLDNLMTVRQSRIGVGSKARKHGPDFCACHLRFMSHLHTFGKLV